jgi:hypothetical protein
MPMREARRGVAVYRAYDIFEVMPDGSTIKRATVSGLEFAKLSLEELSGRTTNEWIAADRYTHQIVAQMNVPLAKRSIKRVFQIAYDDEAGVRRADLLKNLGYGVISVLGNKAAKFLLSSIQHYDLFIVGPGAPEETRRGIVDWLKEKYPTVKILALNPPRQQVTNADYNVTANGPENWLPLLA